jgi:hypothetical protein
MTMSAPWHTLVLLLLVQFAFQDCWTSVTVVQAFVRPSLVRVASHRVWSQPQLLAVPIKHENHEENRNANVESLTETRRRRRPWLRHWVAGMVLLAPWTGPYVAHASAPVMALPKAEERDPVRDALQDHLRRVQKERQAELLAEAAEARHIEATQGEAARRQYEIGLKEKQVQLAENKQAELQALKLSLLQQGIDPFTDVEGRRRYVLCEQGLDLGEVPGTPFYLEQQLLGSKSVRNQQRSVAFRKAKHRQIIACMVQDMVNRGVDPVNYFEKHVDQTEQIMDLPTPQAAALLQKYQANLEQYGQITVPPPGTPSALELKAAAVAPIDAKAEKRAQAAAARAEKEAKAAAARAEKEAKAAAAKEAKAAAVQAAKEAKARAAQEANEEVAETIPEEDTSNTDMVVTEEMMDAPFEDMMTSDRTVATSTTSSVVPAVVGGAFTVAVGGGGYYAFTIQQKNAAQQEAERRERLRLLMGSDKQDSRVNGSVGSMNVMDATVEADPAPAASSTASSSATPAVAAAPPKKKRLGLKNVFSKKGKNDRETDIANLLSPEAPGFEFAKLLAKLLTYGAPGRFPAIVALSDGSMPFDDQGGTYDAVSAQIQLIELRQSLGLSLEESAEIFANVVNCMLIDIVDLASVSLKEKDEKVTFAAISIVVEYMNHAASLYDAVAEGTAITPVTYGGTLGRSKLEQMYSTYATAIMTDMANLPDDFDQRTELLRDVFQISENKAEGLMMKNMMKVLKDAQKDGSLEGMMGGAGGMGGFPGMDGGMPGMMPPGLDGVNPEDIDPSQLNDMFKMIKELKDAGQISPKELEDVRKQFATMFPGSIDDMLSQAKDETERELIENIRAVLAE